MVTIFHAHTHLTTQSRTAAALWLLLSCHRSYSLSSLLPITTAAASAVGPDTACVLMRSPTYRVLHCCGESLLKGTLYSACSCWNQPQLLVSVDCLMVFPICGNKNLQHRQMQGTNHRLSTTPQTAHNSMLQQPPKAMHAAPSVRCMSTCVSLGCCCCSHILLA